jgi:hypothetical protein
MAAYFVRQLVGGFVSVCAMTFILYTISFVFPGGFFDRYITGCTLGMTPSYYARIETELQHYHLHQPFPISYLLWVFDPAGANSAVDKDTLQTLPPSISINIAGYTLSGSGLLTGDFGQSLQVQKGAAPINGSQLDLLDFFARLFLPGIALVCLQRIGHKPYSHRAYRRPLNSCHFSISATRSF